jgi:hypothetical protein
MNAKRKAEEDREKEQKSHKRSFLATEATESTEHRRTSNFQTYAQGK